MIFKKNQPTRKRKITLTFFLNNLVNKFFLVEIMAIYTYSLVFTVMMII